MFNISEDSTPGGESNPDVTDTGKTNGTQSFDVTCAPQNISFPRDVNLLNEARESLEGIVDDL